jgi:hypothetical protein
MASQQHFSEDAVAAADKEMEERANRAKELLSKRHHGLRSQQVSSPPKRFVALVYGTTMPYLQLTLSLPWSHN